ncbi:TetR family transcriptional regulator [Salipaludibacillus neizhouensis]|uniref:TetR family transcriptional regulator n=1 Tax=Salipaludibacillus neizhouensis TaxID=885475 RepID=A0A3A9K4A1_9BACI|nr:TetR/AcrR family transcriptional regulator [Salipaludibacillus neizhouensis]RKL67874.1 TetR family transcriptional regulator [Salipaludibacillus neizhouensis]
MSPRRPASQDLTLEMILQAAQNQFLENDYSHVSMRSIAKELGCSHGALYHHFKNKAELFYAIVEQDFRKLDLLTNQTLLEDGTKKKKLSLIFLRFIQFGLDNQSSYEIMFMYRSEEVNSLAKEVAYLSYKNFADTVGSLCEGHIRIKDIWSTFLSLHGFVSHYCGYPRVDSFADVKEVAEAHVEFLLKIYES